MFKYSTILSWRFLLLSCITTICICYNEIPSGGESLSEPPIAGVRDAWSRFHTASLTQLTATAKSLKSPPECNHVAPYKLDHVRVFKVAAFQSQLLASRFTGKIGIQVDYRIGPGQRQSFSSNDLEHRVEHHLAFEYCDGVWQFRNGLRVSHEEENGTFRPPTMVLYDDIDSLSSLESALIKSAVIVGAGDD